MEWKKIKGFENYEVSNEGEVRNVKNGYILKQEDNGGYLRVTLYVNGKHTHKKIHRLVAEVFIPNPENKPQVNHIDEDKTNNCVENLEWASAKENSNYGTRTQRMKNNPEWKKSNAKHLQRLHESNSKSIIVIYQDDTYEEWPSAAIAAQDLGLWRAHIVDVLKGQRKTTGGLRFEYAE